MLANGILLKVLKMDGLRLYDLTLSKEREPLRELESTLYHKNIDKSEIEF